MDRDLEGGRERTSRGGGGATLHVYNVCACARASANHNRIKRDKAD
jgi:hypothetical protein